NFSTNTSQAQSTSCDYNTPSLNPFLFSDSEKDYLTNVLGFPGSPRNIAVNSADAFQYGTVTTVGGGVKFTQFNFISPLTQLPVFPPTGTSTLPRLFLSEAESITRFDNAANPLTQAQLQAIQTLYAADQVSRRNYALNVANLAKDLTAIRNSGVADPAIAASIDNGIELLREAYKTLSNLALLAPNPRTLYKEIGGLYKTLIAEGVVSSQPVGANILAIGISNYETNRLPVPGGNNTPTATTCTGCFPLPEFDAVRNQPLSQAQARPDLAFGSNVINFLNRINVSGGSAGNIVYQVSSADALQFISVPLGAASGATDVGASLQVFFSNGFPVPAGTVPQFAFTATTADPTFGIVNSAATQESLKVFYSNPANSAARANYRKNLTNLRCAFLQLQELSLGTTANAAVQDSLSILNKAIGILDRGAVPDVLGTYRSLARNLATIIATAPPKSISNNATVKTIGGSLLPIGVINYYFRPILLS
ncbi:MAG: hypothetical protein JNN15_18040, partial [Blastocatellia bacterium]|nr:hypothetical protein [Blastocatellia bacterium]